MLTIRISSELLDTVEAIKQNVELATAGESTILVQPIYRIPPQTQNQKDYDCTPFAIKIEMGNHNDKDCNVDALDTFIDTSKPGVDVPFINEEVL